MTRLSGHTKPIPNHVPDQEFLLRYIEQTTPGDHWLIRDGKRPNRRHNQHGHAFIRLVAKPSVSTHYQGHGEYCLARLFLELTRGPFPPHTQFENTCGLSQCSNPDHWQPVSPRVPWRFELVGGVNWQLVRVRTGKPADKDVVVRARGVDGVVHVFATTPATKRPERGQPTSLCGLSFYAPELVVVSTAVTCTGGC